MIMKQRRKEVEMFADMMVKRLKCNYCDTLVERTGKCECGKVVLSENVVIQGEIGRDYIDYSPMLLNE